jgi:putative hydrolase of the HAD superfamily
MPTPVRDAASTPSTAAPGYRSDPVTTPSTPREYLSLSAVGTAIARAACPAPNSVCVTLLSVPPVRGAVLGSVLRVSISLPGRAVVFDYGEVISFSPSPEDRQRMVEAAGVPAEDLWRAYDADRDRLDQGLLSTTDYWLGIGAACGVSWDVPQAARMWALDFRSWTTADPEVVRVIADLAAGGTRLALLSNAAPDYGAPFRHSPVGALFERVFVSGELLLLKPDPAIYRYAAEALALDPTELVFIDNREVNVRGAESIGITGHVYTDAASLRAFLSSIRPDSRHAAAGGPADGVSADPA